MKNYLKKDEWCIIEEGFNPHYNRISESVFSIGNGHQGQRANFEETYSGETLQGTYMAGVYYPDKTRVGWWKNGYPEYFAKVLNATNWIGIDVKIGAETLDLAKCQVRDFRRILNMREGYLERSFVARLSGGREVKINAQRLVSIVQKEIGAIRYSITPLNFSDKTEVTLYLDGDIKNQDANYGEKFWEEISKQVNLDTAYLTLRTKKTGFYLCSGTTFEVFQNNNPLNISTIPVQKEKYVAHQIRLDLKQGEETIIYKFAANVTSRDHSVINLSAACQKSLKEAFAKGYETLKAEQTEAWARKWEKSDIVIEGDVAAQQGIRFNIFQLDQTYTGEDERLNIGPKGFTGEKYGGSTYWDTEAYCLAFYLATTDTKVARNLLLYRYKQLDKAIENAQKLGFKNGAALFPMVTMNGEECHNEWEITFEEIHRNGAIARAVYDYVNYTGDEAYLADYGLELLIAIARFWSQRVNWSSAKQKYVMLGVTGPNEYENNVNNNWYTNTIAVWCMDYTREVLSYVKYQAPEKYQALSEKLNFDETREVAKWLEISQKMYYPEDHTLGVFLQQEGFLDKEQLTVADLDPKERPINQKWSWDRILRSVFIKQADTLQGVYLFEDRYDIETIRRNFDFYEPRTVHESSLSPCVHSILAAKLGKKEKSYEMYLRTSRLDLDDYNNDTEDGCHTTSMAGTWMSVVQGFGGMRVRKGKLLFNPMIPDAWSSYSFKINFRNSLLKIKVNQEEIVIDNLSEKMVNLSVLGQDYAISGRDRLTVSLAMAEEMK
jgi:maltose phosphorylase